MWNKNGKFSWIKLTSFVVLLDVFLVVFIFAGSGGNAALARDVFLKKAASALNATLDTISSATNGLDGGIAKTIYGLKIGTDKIGEISGRIFAQKKVNDFQKESGLSLAGKPEDVQNVVDGESGVVLGEESINSETLSNQGSTFPLSASASNSSKSNLSAAEILSALDHDLTYEQIAQRGVRRWNLNVGAVNSKKIVDHSIEARDIGTGSVNSRTIEDKSIHSKDLYKNISIRGYFTVEKIAYFHGGTEITGDISADTGTITTLDGTTLAYTLANLTTIDLGTNTITDGNFTGDWDFNSGDLSGLGDVYITGHLGVGASPLTDSRIYAEIQGDAAEGRIAINGEAVNGGSNAYWIKGVMGTGWAAGGGTVDYATGLEANVGASSGATITTGYGVFIDEISGTVTNKFALYQEGTGDINYFAGNVGIGTTTPGNLLTVAGDGNFTGHIALGNAGVVDQTPAWAGGDSNQAAIMIGENISADLSGEWLSSISAYSQYANTGASDAFINGLGVNPTISVSSTGPISGFIGADVRARNLGSGAIGYIYGGVIEASHEGSDDIGTMVGLNASSSSTAVDGASTTVDYNYGAYITAEAVGFETGSTANIGVNYGLYVYSGSQVFDGTANVGNDYSVYIDSPLHSGSMTAHYGLYLANQAYGTSNWAIYSNGGKSYFAGNVGIGTTTPSYKLDIADSTTTRGLNIANSTALSYGLYSVGTKYGAYGSDGTTSGYLGYDDTYGLYTSNNAYVGGTLTLGGALTITGNILPSADDTYNLGDNTHRWANLYLGGETFHIGASTGDEGTIAYDTTNDRLQLNAGAATPSFVITSGGQVGIGTTSPGSKLDISGSERIYDQTAVTGVSTLTIRAGAGQATTPLLALQYDGSNYQNFTIGSTGALYIARNGGAATFTLSENDRVGIGTTAPGQKLEVNGGILSLQTTTTRYAEMGLNLRTSSTAASNVTHKPSPYLQWTGSVWTGAAATQKIIMSQLQGISGQDSQYFLELASSDVANILDIRGDTGYVGIGTTSPGAHLTVLGDNQQLKLQSSTATSAVYGTLTTGNGTGYGWMGVEGSVGNTTFGGSSAYATIFGSGSAHSTQIISQGSVRMTIDSGGNVGIGTTNPNYQLDVVGYIRVKGTDPGIYIGDPSTAHAGGGYLIYNTAGNYLTINAVSASDAFRNIGLATDGGNVGIGTTTPVTKLTIGGGVSYGGLSIITTDYSAGVAGSYFGITQQANTGNTYVDIRQLTNGAGAWGNIVLQSGGGNVGIGTTTPGAKLDVVGTVRSTSAFTVVSSAYIGTYNFWVGGGSTTDAAIGAYGSNLTFFTNNSTTERMRIDAAGNVGIGTTTPLEILHIIGNFRASSLAGSGNRCVYADSNGTIHVKSFDCGSASGGDNLGDHVMTQNLQTGGYWISNDGDNEGIFVGSTGNVGIGTTSPGAKLEILDTYSLKFGNNIFTGNSGASIGANNSMNIGVTSNNSLAFFTNDTLQMMIKNYGYVGIGTTNPQQELHILGNGINAGLMISDSAARVRFGMYSFASGNNEFGFGPVDLQIGTISDTAFSGFSEKMRITTGGNVGIGTTSPADILHLSKAGDLYLRVANTSTGINAYLGQDSNGTYIGNTGASVVRFIQGASERMRIDTSGNVGIGTTTPGDLLSLYGDAKYLQIAHPTNTSYSGIIFKEGTTNLGTIQSIGSNFATSSRRNNMEIDAGSGAVVIQGLGAQNIWLATGGGNVGIGTTSPQQTLEVAGALMVSYSGDPATYNMYVTPFSLGAGKIGYQFITKSWTGGTNTPMTFDNAGNVGIGTTTPGAKLEIDSDTASGLSGNLILSNLATGNVANGAGLFFNLKSSTGTVYNFGRMTVTSNDITGPSEDGTMGFDVMTAGTQNQRVMTLKDGSVGIGTTTPGQKLEVVGNVQTTTGDLYTRRDAADTSDWSFGNFLPGGSIDSNLHIGNFTAARGTWQEYISATSGGNVGIGTVSPQGRLDLGSTLERKIIYYHNGGDNGAGVRTASGLLVDNFIPAVSEAFTWSTYTGTWASPTYTERMRITVGGNVGIGTTNPSTQLHLFKRDDTGAAAGMPEFRLEHQDIRAIGSGGTNGGKFNFYNIQQNNTAWAANSVWGEIGFYPSQPTAGTAQIGAKILAAADGALNGTSTNSYLSFSTTDVSTLTERMRITSGGNVGIGTTDAQRPLTIYNSDSGSSNTQIEARAVANGYWAGINFTSYRSSDQVLVTQARIQAFGVANYSDATNTSSALIFSTVNANTLAERVRIGSSGALKFSAYGAGTLVTDASGNVTASSDERLKNVTGSFNRGLSAVMGLDPISFYWKASSGMDTKNEYSGFSAQNIRDFIPEAIDTDPRGYLALSDRPILAATVNAIQEQQTQIGDLQTQNSNLKTQNQSLNLKTDENINTVQELQAAVNDKLSVVGNMLDAQEISINKVKSDFEDFQKTFTDYQTEANNLFASLIETDKLLTDRITSLEDKIATLSVSCSGENCPPAGAVPENVVTQDTEGNVILAGIFKAKDVQAETGSFKGALAADTVTAKEVSSEGVVAGAFAVKNDGESEKKDTIGSGTILEVKKDADNDGVDDDTGSDGKSVVIKNTAVKKDSKIFVTSRTMLDQPLVVTKIKDGESFTVEKKSPTNQDIDFDWWIIGSE